MKGEVVYLYAFDVANEIVTANIREILGRKPFPFQIRGDRTLPRDVPLYQPMAVEAPTLKSCLAGKPVSVLVRIYDVGVITVTMRVGFEAEQLTALLPMHNPRLESGQLLDAMAKELCCTIFRELEPFMVRPSSVPVPEAYTAFCFSDLGPFRNVSGWLAEQGRNIAGLLSEIEPERLSEAQVADVLRLQRSFENTDLVVVDWDAALVVDLTGYVEDVLYVLELANVQLEEFRMMDATLDRYLNKAYEDLEKRRLPLLGPSRTLQALRWFRVDLSKLADEVTHITKFFGDWYLARVYMTVRERFHLDQWRTSVERRLTQLDQLYSVVHAEINERRMLWLEIIIVILFIIDVLALFLWKH